MVTTGIANSCLSLVERQVRYTMEVFGAYMESEVCEFQFGIKFNSSPQGNVNTTSIHILVFLNRYILKRVWNHVELWIIPQNRSSPKSKLIVTQTIIIFNIYILFKIDQSIYFTCNTISIFKNLKITIFILFLCLKMYWNNLKILVQNESYSANNWSM